MWVTFLGREFLYQNLYTIFSTPYFTFVYPKIGYFYKMSFEFFKLKCFHFTLQKIGYLNEMSILLANLVQILQYFTPQICFLINPLVKLEISATNLLLQFFSIF